MPRPAPVRPVWGFLQALATVVLVVFVLYAARPVIIPFALAVFGTFILAPIVTLIERTGLKRVPAALATLALAGLVLTGIAWVISSQATDLIRDLPNHKEEIKRKVDQLRGSGGPISALVDLFKDVVEGGKAVGDAAATATQSDGTKPAPPQTVIVTRVDDSSQFTRLAESGIALVEPLAAAALVAVLVAFMLIGREDLRDRLVGVLGRGQMLGTTRVLAESAEKVSRFLLFALLVNAGFGLFLTAGLLVVGVPYAPLWGFLSMILRFIPYVGTWISALFPFALSFATSEGWTQPVTVVVYFAVLDLITANVVEPLLFGHHTGVSPLALLIAVAFWTWIWGPLGLLLSTPITVCLAVIGQHVPRLRPLALLLGDQPALAPAVQFYQRLVSKDPAGAKAVVAEATTAGGLVAAYDTVILPALVAASRDRARGELTAEEEVAVFEGTAEIVDAAPAEATPAADAKPAKADAKPAKAGTAGVVIGVPAHRSAEGLPVRMVANVLRTDGYRVEATTTQMLPTQVGQLAADLNAKAVVVSVMPPGGLPQTLFLCDLLRKRFPDLPIVVAYNGSPAGYDKLLVRLRAVGVNYVTTSVEQTCNQLRALVPVT